MYRTLALFFLGTMALTACTCGKKTVEEPITETMVQTVAVSQSVAGGSSAVASPRVIVYKTKKDYSNNVPVMMDETKTRITSYPAPSDVCHKPVPTMLDNGYLLDNRGIGGNAVFTSWTYEEYAALEKTPSHDEFLAHIIDRDPIAEMWMCDHRHTYKNLVNDLNKLIKAGFAGCTKVK